MCHPRKASHHHDEGSSISAQNQRTMGWFGMMLVSILLSIYAFLLSSFCISDLVACILTSASMTLNTLNSWSNSYNNQREDYTNSWFAWATIGMTHIVSECSIRRPQLQHLLRTNAWTRMLE